MAKSQSLESVTQETNQLQRLVVSARLSPSHYVKLEWLATRVYRCSRGNVIKILIDLMYNSLQRKAKQRDLDRRLHT